MFGFNTYNINETMNIDKLDTHNVVDMEKMFQYTKYDKLSLLEFNTSKVTNMNDMFFASKIRELDISKFNINSIQTLKNMFFISTIDTLKLFDIPSGINVSNMLAYSNIDKLILGKMNIGHDNQELKSVFAGANINKIILTDKSKDTIGSLHKMLESTIREMEDKPIIGNFSQISTLCGI